MKQKVEIRVINPKQEGINKVGTPWVSQEVVIAWPDMKPIGDSTENRLCVRFRNEEQQKFEAMHLVVGSEVMVDLQFSTYESENGYVNNSVKAVILNEKLKIKSEKLRDFLNEK